MRTNDNGCGARTARAALVLVLLLGAAGPVRADDFQETLPAQAEGTLRVELDRGSVEVEAHARPEVRVDARADGMEFELNREGDAFELRGQGRGGFLSLFGGGRVRVRVRVPKRFSVDVRTQGGSIDVERLEGAVSAHTQGGSIDVEGAQGPVRLQTSGGSIRFSRTAASRPESVTRVVAVRRRGQCGLLDRRRAAEERLQQIPLGPRVAARREHDALQSECTQAALRLR